MQEFSKPTFEGKRFDSHTLPLEAAEDLIAYERLIRELAKHLYLHENPTRQRVPKGFDKDFQLHLERLDPGSTKPVLGLIAAGALAITSGASYFTEARDVVAECIASEPDQLPSKFPKHLLKHFNYFGKSLRADESLTLASPTSTSAKLTSDRRKKLVLAANKVYEKEIQLEGMLDAPNFDKGEFLLRLLDGSTAVCPLPEEYHDEARSIVGIERHLLTIKGTGTFDAWENLKKVLEITEWEIQMNYQIAQKLEPFTQLEDGWCGEGSKAFDSDALGQLADRIATCFPVKVSLPAIVPTQDANLLLEWNCPGHPSVDINISTLYAELHAFAPDESDIEATFDLNIESDWKRLMNRIQELGC